jgi:UDP-GlcNAc:undecaprenyl-phosphate GlcNAc-1-phosphate transferase
MKPLLPYIVFSVMAVAVSVVLTPIVIVAARRLRLYDPRDARKVHNAPTPRVGGIAIVMAMLVSTLASFAVYDHFWMLFSGMQHQLTVLFAASTFIFVIGVLDDVVGVRAVIKLCAQTAAAIFVCAMGIRIGFIPSLGALGWLDWPVTILWILAITNAVNLIDGLDGLAAGIAAATCAVIAAFNFYSGYPAMGLLMLALLGSLVGFLLFNFNPARIFMGDSGSLFLGFFLATASIMSATKVAMAMGLIVPALAMGLPLFDMMLSVVRRMLERRSVFAADKGHIHHRLLEKGLNHPQAVIVMYLVTVLAAGAGLMMMLRDDGGEIVVFAVALVMLMFVFRLAGMLSLRELFTQVRNNLNQQRVILRDRRQFETTRNKLRAAWTFEQWWRVVRRLARRMGFTELRITIQPRENEESQTHVWRLRGGARSQSSLHTHLSIPVVGPKGSEVLRMEIHIPANQSLETIGRRLSLFGRLIDEHHAWDESDAAQTESATIS